MTDIDKLRQLLEDAKPDDYGSKPGEYGHRRTWSALACAARDDLEAALPALLDELERLRGELAHMANDAGGDSCAAYAVENARMREALAFYADIGNHALRITHAKLREIVTKNNEERAVFEQKYGLPMSVHDKGARARKALGLPEPADDDIEGAYWLQLDREIKARAALKGDK